MARTNEQARVYWNANKHKYVDSQRKRARAYHEKHKDGPEYKAKRAAYYQKTKEKQHAKARVKSKTPEGRSGPRYSSMHIDHDHGTGCFRGFLCARCNIMLGHAEDKPSTLRKAANYLEASCSS